MDSEYDQVVKDGVKTVSTGAKKFIRKALLILLALAIVGGGGYIWVCGWTYSHGSRAGYLVKVSTKGVIWKTHEGELNLGGFQTGSEGEGVTGNIWSFSVPDGDLYDKLQGFEGERIRLEYRQVYKPMPWQGKTDYFVIGVNKIKE